MVITVNDPCTPFALLFAPAVTVSLRRTGAPGFAMYAIGSTGVRKVAWAEV